MLAHAVEPMYNADGWPRAEFAAAVWTLNNARGSLEAEERREEIRFRQWERSFAAR